MPLWPCRAGCGSHFIGDDLGVVVLNVLLIGAASIVDAAPDHDLALLDIIRDGPAYSPDLNLIEMAFAKLKAHLRRIDTRTINDLWKAVGSICDLYDPDECRNYFAAAGYALD